MSRASIILIVVVVALLAGLIALGVTTHALPTHHVEKDMLNAAAPQ